MTCVAAQTVTVSPFAIWVHRWMTGVACWALLVLSSCGFVAWVWNGAFVTDHSFEDWIQAVEGDGPNQETARNQLYLKMRAAIMALKSDGAEREIELLRKDLR